MRDCDLFGSQFVVFSGRGTRLNRGRDPSRARAAKRSAAWSILPRSGDVVGDSPPIYRSAPSDTTAEYGSRVRVRHAGLGLAVTRRACFGPPPTEWALATKKGRTQRCALVPAGALSPAPSTPSLEPAGAATSTRRHGEVTAMSLRVCLIRLSEYAGRDPDPCRLDVPGLLGPDPSPDPCLGSTG